MKKITAFAAVLIMLLTCFFGCASAKFTVTYNVDGVLSTETVDSGSTASCAKPENAEGKTFDGWYTDDALTLIYDEKTPVTKDVTLYGTWRETKPQRYVVTFIVDEIPYEVAVNAGEAAAFDEPKKSGYTFNGWYTDQACTKKFDLSAPIAGDLTLYAGWTQTHIPRTFVVSFDLAGGTAEPAIGSQSIEEGGRVLRPQRDPVRENYIFEAWYKGEESYNFADAVNASFTLTAHWKEENPDIPDGPKATATSSAEGHAASLAIDGNAATFWQAAEAGKACLTLDLGEISEVRSVKQTFAEAKAWNFVVEGSTDGELWAELGKAAGQGPQAAYEVSANGYFRYVRLNVQSGGVPSSKEFEVGLFDLSGGTNIALGMKGSADSWAPGCETEMAFDGKYGTYWCSNDEAYPKYLAVEWTYTAYVNYVDFCFTEEGTHNYEVEARLEDDSWIKLEEAADHDGQTVRLEVKREVNAVLIRQFSGPTRANIAEMNVYGFKNVAYGLTPVTEGGYDVYPIGESYLYGAATNGDVAEYSADGKTWTAFSAEAGVSEGAQAAYVRVKSDSQIKIFATPFKTDLARYVVPTASDYSNEGYRPGIATMNPENVWVQSDSGGHFWCAASWGGPHTLELDFGNVCIINGFRYTFQDEIAEPKYKLKIELSEDGSEWTVAFDNSAAGDAGKVFEGDIENVRARYVKITAEYVEGWTNCKNLQIYGIGAPVRDIEIR